MLYVECLDVKESAHDGGWYKISFGESDVITQNVTEFPAMRNERSRLACSTVTLRKFQWLCRVAYPYG